MAKRLLGNLRVGHGHGSVELQTGGFGTLSEFAALVEADSMRRQDRSEAGKDPRALIQPASPPDGMLRKKDRTARRVPRERRACFNFHFSYVNILILKYLNY